MGYNIPVEQKANQDVEYHHYSSIETKRNPSIKCADFWERNTIDIVALNSAVLAAVRDLYNRINPRENNHNEKPKEHEFDEAEIESHWLINIRNLTITGLAVFQLRF